MKISHTSWKENGQHARYLYELFLVVLGCTASYGTPCTIVRRGFGVFGNAGKENNRDFILVMATSVVRSHLHSLASNLLNLSRVPSPLLLFFAPRATSPKIYRFVKPDDQRPIDNSIRLLLRRSVSHTLVFFSRGRCSSEGKEIVRPWTRKLILFCRSNHRRDQIRRTSRWNPHCNYSTRKNETKTRNNIFRNDAFFSRKSSLNIFGARAKEKSIPGEYASRGQTCPVSLYRARNYEITRRCPHSTYSIPFSQKSILLLDIYSIVSTRRISLFTLIVIIQFGTR